MSRNHSDLLPPNEVKKFLGIFETIKSLSFNYNNFSKIDQVQSMISMLCKSQDSVEIPQIITFDKIKKIPLPKWSDVYPQGTQAGDEEQKFFIVLARNTKYQWRSVAAIVKETGLSQERVEQILSKYHKRKMVYQNPKDENQWGYWERVPEMVENITPSISDDDQKSRIKNSKP